MRNRCDIERDIRITKATLTGYEKELKELDSKTYSTGQWFKNSNGTIAVLAQVDGNMGALICCNSKDANRWTEPVKIKSCRQITQEEFNEMCTTETWTPIDTPQELKK